jgi:hypothetical protein
MPNTTEDGRECLDFHNDHKGPCDDGPVMYHPSIAGTGTMIPRCEKHYQALLDWNDEYSQVMPDSNIAPSWFDPTAIGEHWGDDY